MDKNLVTLKQEAQLQQRVSIALSYEAKDISIWRNI